MMWFSHSEFFILAVFFDNISKSISVKMAPARFEGFLNFLHFIQIVL